MKKVKVGVEIFIKPKNQHEEKYPPQVILVTFIMSDDSSINFTINLDQIEIEVYRYAKKLGGVFNLNPISKSMEELEKENYERNDAIDMEYISYKIISYERIM